MEEDGGEMVARGVKMAVRWPKMAPRWPKMVQATLGCEWSLLRKNTFRPLDDSINKKNHYTGSETHGGGVGRSPLDINDSGPIAIHMF